jgi:hypothetical protein
MTVVRNLEVLGELREVARRAADGHADPDSFFEERERMADAFVERFFSVVRLSTDRDSFKYADSWAHRGYAQLETDWRLVTIDREGLRNVAVEYLDDVCFQTPTFDWLVADLLAYAEILSFFDHRQKRRYGLVRYGTRRNGDPAMKWLIRGVRLVAWGMFAAVTAIASWLGTAALGLWCAAVLLWWITDWLTLWRCDRLLKRMFSAYSSLNTLRPGWGHVWQSLRESTQYGAIWDAALFDLAERRRQAS